MVNEADLNGTFFSEAEILGYSMGGFRFPGFGREIQLPSMSATKPSMLKPLVEPLLHCMRAAAVPKVAPKNSEPYYGEIVSFFQIKVVLALELSNFPALSLLTGVNECIGRATWDGQDTLDVSRIGQPRVIPDFDLESDGKSLKVVEDIRKRL